MKKAVVLSPAVIGMIVSFALLDAAAFQPPADLPPGGPGPGLGPGGRRGFGPGTFLAPRIFELVDANHDGELTPEEAAGGAEELVREASTAENRSIDAEGLGLLIDRNLGPPPGFAPDAEPDLRPDEPPPGAAPPGAPGGPPPGGPGGFFPGGLPPGGPGGPGGGFGPGMFLAPRILQAADADKDGRLSPDEAAQAAARFVRSADASKMGSINVDVLADALNRRVGPPPGFGPGGPMGQEKKLVAKFDKDGDHRLNRAERDAARKFLKEDQAGGRGGRGFGFGMGFGPPPGRFGRRDEPQPSPGPKVAKSDVPSHTGKPLYDPTIIRTIFLDFENPDWEAETAAFYNSDVEVPAVLTIDGEAHRGVGVHFRGMSSFFGVREGRKRSLNVSVDYTDSKQRVLGYKTLNLLNSHEDPSFLHTILYFDLARRYIPAPKANFVRVVINGESWGLYVNAQQFDKIFLAENSTSGKGARWKVRGSPGGAGGLDYIGDDVKNYETRYEMKSGGDDDWKALIALCKTLSRTPADGLESAVAPLLDIDGALWFLALENALVNSDGYWIRASDYNLFRDRDGKFHVVPHDANETFQPAMGPGMGMGPGGPGMGMGPGFGQGGPGGRGGFGGPPDRIAGGAVGKGGRGAAAKRFGGRFGGGPGGPAMGPGGPGMGPGIGVKLDPLIGLDDERKPLRSKLLAVPSLRARYLDHVRAIAEEWLDWNKLGPIVAEYRTLIEKEVEADFRKLSSTEDFRRATSDAPPPRDGEEADPRRRSSMSLREFAAKRRDYLLNEAASKKAR